MYMASGGSIRLNFLSIKGKWAWSKKIHIKHFLKSQLVIYMLHIIYPTHFTGIHWPLWLNIIPETILRIKLQVFSQLWRLESIPYTFPNWQSQPGWAPQVSLPVGYNETISRKFLVKGIFKLTDNVSCEQRIGHHWESNLQPLSSEVSTEPVELTWRQTVLVITYLGITRTPVQK